MSQNYIPFDDLELDNIPNNQQVEGEIPVNGPAPVQNNEDKSVHNQQQYLKSQSSASINESQEELNDLIDNNKKSKSKRNKVQSIQEKQQSLEKANHRSLRRAILKRSCFRVVMLIFLACSFMFYFYNVYENMAFFDGAVKIQNNSDIFINGTNCKINIMDSNYIDDQSMRTSIKNIGNRYPLYVKEQDKSNSNDGPDIGLIFTIPGRYNINPQANVSNLELHHNQTHFEMVFDNILTPQSCEIDIHIYKKTMINNLTVICANTCYVMIHSNNISFNTFALSGDLIESNIAYLQATTLNYRSIQGRFQATYLDVSQSSDIYMESGDIIIQSDHEMMVNWTHALPHYCLAAPVIANPLLVGCVETSDKEIKAYIEGVGAGEATSNKTHNVSKESNKTSLYENFFDDEEAGNVVLIKGFENYEKSHNIKKQMHNSLSNVTKNLHSKKSKLKAQFFRPLCYGNVILCHTSECSSLRQSTTNLRFMEEKKPNKTKSDYQTYYDEAQQILPHVIPKGVRFFNITGRFGNIYVNLIKQAQEVVTANDTLFFGSSYQSGQINFSIPSLKSLQNSKHEASDPHNFDPSFILEVGSKMTRSDNYQQWQVTYNPAYSYIRPWWIGTFTFTLMSTATFDLHLSLSPGFCPYVPVLNLDNLYATKFLIESYFEDAENKITSLAWQNEIPIPGYEFEIQSDGFRKYIESNDEFERWLQMDKLNESNYLITIINQDSSFSTRWAVRISLVISFLMAGFLLMGLIYMVNAVYLQIIEQVSSTNKYSELIKDKDEDTQQPLMKINQDQIFEEEEEEEDKERKVKGKPKPKSKPTNQKIDIQLSFNITRLLSQLFFSAPPLSAFLDYLWELVRKQYFNSVKIFYTHLFSSKELSDDEKQIHDLSTEAILGSELKTLFEKFCYLNGFLEDKLDDPQNLQYLAQKGFKLETHSDAQTESFLKVLLNGFIPKLKELPKDKNSLELFISNCCKTTNFEEDNIVATTFNEKYEEFCELNHLEKIAVSTASLQQFNIVSKYIPQQWLERIEQIIQDNNQQEEQSTIQKIQQFFVKLISKCLPTKKTYFLNRQKIENHFLLILNNPQMIKTPEEITIANNELILFDGWMLADCITVIIHLLTTIILIIPLFSQTILEKVLYAEYSLIPSQYLITQEDILQNFWLIPIKLYNESMWIKNILKAVIIYWIYSIIDLIYYYFLMEFPQENFFRKVQPHQTNKLQKFFRIVMWILVCYSAFIFFIFITLAAVWLMLGAIVNPSAFLPYATAAATFVVVVSGKAAQFKELAENGFQVIIKYIESIAQEQMGSMIKKFDLKEKMDQALDSETFKKVAGQAASLGIVDKDALMHLQENADQMLKDPAKVLENSAKELQDIASDPAVFVQNIMKEVEKKALVMINEQISKQIPGYGEHISKIVLSLFKKDQQSFKNEISQLLIVASAETKIESLRSINQPVLNLMWEFAYQSKGEQNHIEDYLQQLILPCTDCFTTFIAEEANKLIDNPESKIEPKLISICLTKSISLEKNIQKLNYQAIYNDLDEMITQLKVEDRFPLIKKISQYGGLLNIAMSLFETNDRENLSFHKIFKIIEGFFDNIQPLKEMKDMLGVIELLVNSFKKQQRSIPTKIIRQKVDRALQFINYQLQEQKVSVNANESKLLKNGALLTLVFNFIQNHFDKMPKDMMSDVFRLLFDQFREFEPIKKLIVSEKEMKRFVKVATNGFEFVQLLMEDTKELTQKLHHSAAAFSIEGSKAQQLQEVTTLKHLQHKCSSGSKKESLFFEQLRQNQIIKLSMLKLRIDDGTLLGILSLLLNLNHRQELQDLYQTIAKINKVELRRVKQFFDVLTLQTSTNHVHIQNAALNLNIPKEYISIILVFKKILEIKYIDEESLLKVNISKETLLALKNPNISYEDMMKLLTSDLLQQIDDNLVEGGNSIQMRKFLFSQLLKTQQITQNYTQLLLMSLSTNINEFATLKQFEINLLMSVLQLKQMDLFSSPSSFTSETKQGVYQLAFMINIDRYNLEDLINVIFLNSADRVLQSIKNLTNKQFIPENKQQEYSQFLDYIYSKTDLIGKKSDFFSSKFQELFPMIKLPTALIQKLIFNKHIPLDINSIYKLADMILPQGEHISRSHVLKQLSRSINLLGSSPTINLRELLDESQEVSEGMGCLFQIINETSMKRSLQQYLDYLAAQSKKNKNEENNDKIPQIFLMYVCLFLFFNGKHNDLHINYYQSNGREKIISILEFISIQLDIKQEFFESLHSYYSKDTQKFTQTMIKYMRRQQACLFEKEHPGIKIPIQSLVKLPEQIVINFINLIMGQDYQPSYFSKELNLNPNLILFISILAKIKNVCFKQSELTQHLGFISKNSKQIGPLLETIQVNPEELVILMKLLFQNYNTNELQQMMNGLGLGNKTNIANITNLLNLDSRIILENERQQCLFQLNSQLNENQLIQNMKLPQELIKCIKLLTSGCFSLIDQVGQLIPFFNYPDVPQRQEYYLLVGALCGLISGVQINKDLNISQFLIDINQCLEGKIKQEVFQQQLNNDITQSVFQLAHILDMNPMITMLSLGIPQAWQFLNEIYYTKMDAEAILINPIIILEMILTYSVQPTLFKEIYMEYQWQEMLNDEYWDQHYESFPFMGEINFPAKEGYTSKEDMDKLKQLMFGELITSEFLFKSLIQKAGLNSSLISLLGVNDKELQQVHGRFFQESTNQYIISIKRKLDKLEKSDKKEEYQLQLETTLDQLKQIQQVIDNEELLNFEKVFQKLQLDETIWKQRKSEIIYRGFKLVLTQLEGLCKLSQAEKPPIYISTLKWNKKEGQLFFLSSLIQLRNAYWVADEGITLRDTDHCKIVTINLDFATTYIDRFYFYKDFTDYCSKYRLIQLLGLSAGFVIRSEQILQANCLSQILDYKVSNSLFSLAKNESINNQVQMKLITKWQTVYCMASMRKNYTDNSAQQLFRIYNFQKILHFQSNVYIEPELYYSSIQQNKTIQFEMYFYELAFLERNSEMRNYLMYKKQNNFKEKQFNEEVRQEIVEVFAQGSMKYQVEAKFKNEMKIYNQQMQTQQQQNISIKQPEKQTPTLENIIDVKSGQSWSMIFKSQKIWKDCCTNQLDNLKLVIDIFKGNYQSITDADTYFVDEEISSAQLYNGLLGINQAHLKVSYGWQQNSGGELSQYLNNLCWNTKSNKKNIQEIISIYYGCFEGMNIIGTAFEQNIGVINNFIKLSCQLVDSSQMENCFDSIIGAANLNKTDTIILRQIITSYFGNAQDAYYSLVEMSQYITPRLDIDKQQVSLQNLIKKKRNQIQQVQVVKKIENEQEKMETITYFKLSKLIKNLLSSFDTSFAHKLDIVDPNTFNFYQYSATSFGFEQNSFKNILWQLAQSATRDTVTPNLRLPILNEMLESTDESLEVQQYIQFHYNLLDAIITQDYSFIFTTPVDQAVLHLKELKLVETETQFKIIKSVICLKSKFDFKQKLVTQQFDEHSASLHESNLIKFQIYDDVEKDQQLSKNVSSLFLSLSQWNIDKIVQSLMNCDEINASFISTLHTWSNLTTIIHDPQIFILDENIQNYVFSSLKILPLMVYSQVHESQDIQKGQFKFDHRKKILNSVKLLVNNVKTSIPNQEYYDKLKQTRKLHKKIKFTWSMWLINLPPLFEKMREFFAHGQFQTFNESELIFKVLTGQIFMEKLKSVRLIGPILDFYLVCNKLINFPQTIGPQESISQLIPKLIQPLAYIFPKQLRQYTGVFDKFVELLVFIQIPKSSLNILYKKKVNELEYAEIYHNSHQVVQVEEASQENEQQLIMLVLDVLKQTVTDLYTSFKQQHKSQTLDELNKSQENMLKLTKLAKQMDQQPINNNSSIAKSPTNMNYLTKNMIIQPQNVIKSLQMTGPISALGQPLPQPTKSIDEQLAEEDIKLKRLQHELQHIEKGHDEAKQSIMAIIALLTGYNLTEKKKIQDQEERVDYLCFIVDSLLFKNLDLLKYVNTGIIKKLYTDIRNLINQPIKSIENAQFMDGILSLLHTISGQDNPKSKLNENQQKSLKHKNMDFHVHLPKRIKIIELPMPVITCIFDLTQHKLSAISTLLRQFKVGDGVVKFVENIIQQVQDMGVFGSNKSLLSQTTTNERTERINLLMKKIETGEATSDDMFDAIDEDGSGSINKTEYNNLAKRLGMNLSEHRINEIFASIKKNHAETDDDGLNKKEFGLAMKYLQQKNTNMALDFLGISPALLTSSLVLLALILVLIFIFIFLGIQAFALGGTFGAIVNSILPMAAGGGAGTKSQKLDKSDKSQSIIEESVDKTQKIIQSDTI